MLKHIPIPTVPTSSSVLTTFANSRPSRPTPITSIHNRSQQPLNVSTLTTVSNGGPPSLLQTFPNSHQSPLLTHTYPPDLHKPIQNGHVRMFTPLPTFSSNSQQQLLKSCGGNNSNLNNISSSSLSSKSLHSKECNGTKEALTSLGLLCLALLSLTFLLKITPGTKQQQHLLATSIDEYAIVFDVTLALCALSLSLNLCCLLVCAVQFLFTVKLLATASSNNVIRENRYLQKSSASRVCAIGGFFISIPIFLTGIILYTFIQFHSTPAIVTSVLIGVSILFCGGAMVHNVFIWQKEKTIVFNCMKKQQQHQMQHHLNIPPNIQSPMHHHHPMQGSFVSRQTPLNLSLNSPISTIHNPPTNSSTRDITLELNNHSYVNGGGLAHINSTLNNTHLSLLSQAAVTPNSYFMRTTPPTPTKSAQLHNGSPNASTTLDQTTSFRNASATTAHELSNFNLSTLV